MTRYTTTGNTRFWEHRPSDHIRGNRLHWHGPLIPLEDKRGLLSRLSTLFGKDLHHGG